LSSFILSYFVFFNLILSLIRYKVQRSDFIKNGGSGLLSEFNESPSAVIVAVFKDYTFLPWLFAKVPSHFFERKSNRRVYVQWLLKQVKVRSVNELTYDDFSKNGGSALLKTFRGSPYKIAQSLLDDYQDIDSLGRHKEDEKDKKVAMEVNEEKDKEKKEAKEKDEEVKPWQFLQVSAGFWNSLSNQRDYLEWLGRRLHFSRPQDWYFPYTCITSLFLLSSLFFFYVRYQVKRSDFVDNDGSGFLSMFGGSPAAAVMTVYPEFPYKTWLFAKAPNRVFQTIGNRREYLEWLMKEVNVTCLSDLTPEHLSSNGGSTLLHKYGGSISKVLASLKTHFEEKNESGVEEAIALIISRGSAPRNFFVLLPLSISLTACLNYSSGFPGESAAIRGSRRCGTRDQVR